MAKPDIFDTPQGRPGLNRPEELQRLRISILSTLRRTDDLFLAGKHAEACGMAEQELRHVLAVIGR